MNHSRYNCQFKKVLNFTLLMLLLVLVSCTNKKVTYELERRNDDFSDNFFPNYQAKWFDLPRPYRVLDRKGGVQRHTFYDPSPNIDKADSLVNFVVETPVDSGFNYEMDLASGLNHKTHRYCKQGDIWELYTNPVTTPPYTEGFIPRILDRTGKPQQILVFGNDKYYRGLYSLNTRRVRVVGALVEQYCEVGNCTTAKSWLNRLVLIAVDPEDEELAQVDTISQLKQKIDWQYVRAFRENGKGINIVAKNLYPAYRLGGEVQSFAAINYLEKQAKIFKQRDLFRMRRSCLKLYSFIWKNLGSYKKVKDKKISTKKAKALRAQIANLKSEFSSKNKKYTKHPKYDFINNFKAILTGFGEHYNTCIEFVKPSNVNTGFRRHWFFAYLSAVMKLYDLDYYYNCSNKSWYANSRDLKDELVADPVEALGQCNSDSINKMFSYAINYIRTLNLSGHKYYRYIDYDNGIGGTHNKIHSWVPVLPQALYCSRGFLGKRYNSRKDKLETIFPKDVLWTPIE